MKKIGSIISSLDELTGYAAMIHVVGKYAYLLTFKERNIGTLGTFYVIDISYPSNPIVKGLVGINMPYGAYNIYALGHHVFYTAHPLGLQVIDVSDSLKPKEIKFSDMPWRARGVYVIDNYAYVIDSLSLQVIDVNDLSNPEIIGCVSTPPYTYAKNVYAVGNYAYVAHIKYNASEKYDAPGLHVIDISIPNKPLVVGCIGEILPNITPYVDEARIYISTDYAYMVIGGTLHVVNISDPFSPQLIDSVNIPGVALCVSGNYIYVATETYLQIIDISTPSRLKIVDSINTSGSVWDICVIDNHIYVATGLAGLKVIEIKQ